MSLRGRTSHYSFGLIALLALALAPAAFAEPVPDTCEIHYPSDTGIAWTCHRIGPHETLSGLFGSHWEDVLRFNRIDRRHIYPGVRIKVPDDLQQVDGFSPMPKRYPPAVGDAKFILVDLTEQFLGAYAFGNRVMSFPISSGENADPALRTPDGRFTVTAYDRLHSSSLYDLADTDKAYPMHYALRFLINSHGAEVWIHGRDVPGYAASHGCIGLYDEQMQKEYYGYPRRPILEDAETLYEWVIASQHPHEGRLHDLVNGPPVLIVGHAPDFPPLRTRGAKLPTTSGTQPSPSMRPASCGK